MQASSLRFIEFSGALVSLFADGPLTILSEVDVLLDPTLNPKLRFFFEVFWTRRSSVKRTSGTSMMFLVSARVPLKISHVGIMYGFWV